MADVLADAGICAENRSLNNGGVHHADVRQASLAIAKTLAVGFKTIRSVKDSVLNGHIAPNAATETDHAMTDLGAGLDHAAVAHQALFQLGAAYPGRRQEPHSGVDDSFLGVEVERRVIAGQCQIRLVVSLDGSLVLPAAVKQMGLKAMVADAIVKPRSA